MPLLYRATGRRPSMRSLLRREGNPYDWLEKPKRFSTPAPLRSLAIPMASRNSMLSSAVTAPGWHPRLAMACTQVRGLVLLPIRIFTMFASSITVPCNFDIPISVYVGGKEVKISPASFNLGPVSPGSDTCIGGAASDAGLKGGKLAFTFMRMGIKLTFVQNFGFSVMFFCRTFTLLGMSVTSPLALLTFFKTWNHSRSRQGRCGLPLLYMYARNNYCYFLNCAKDVGQSDKGQVLAWLYLR